MARPTTTVTPYPASPLNSSTTAPGSSPAMRATTPAMSANTKKGAASITRSTIFMNTSLQPFMKAVTGPARSPGIMSRVMPKKMAKKITCSINVLLKLRKMLLGTMSTRNCSGPASLVALACCTFSPIQSSAPPA